MQRSVKKFKSCDSNPLFVMSSNMVKGFLGRDIVLGGLMTAEIFFKEIHGPNRFMESNVCKDTY